WRNRRSIASIGARSLALRYDMRVPVTLRNRPAWKTQLVHALQVHSVAVRYEHRANATQGVALHVLSEIQLAISALTAPQEELHSSHESSRVMWPKGHRSSRSQR